MIFIKSISEYKLLIFPKNIDTSAVMRVVIKDFNMTASELERLWAEQDNYIDLLESQQEVLSFSSWESYKSSHHLQQHRDDRDQSGHINKTSTNHYHEFLLKYLFSGLNQ